MVDRLKRDLEGLFEAHTGKSLRIFIDRESIGWGVDWRQDIRSSVERSTVFIPIITMRYFASQSCRDELLTFYNNAEQLGVTNLLLPVVLAGEDQIADSDPREEVRLIERLNHKRIHGAWLAGYDSAEWRTMVFSLVTSLDSALRSAEDSLVARHEEVARQQDVGEGNTPGVGVGLSSRVPGSEPDADFSALTERFGELVPLLAEVLAVLESFSSIAAETVGSASWENVSPQLQKVQFLRAAQALTPVSRAVGDKGAELQMATAEADLMLRTVFAELGRIDSPTARQGLEALLDGIGQPSTELADVAGKMDELENVLRMASMMNVSLRKALRSGIHGVQAIKSAVATVQSWTRLVM